jgi:hypothetical protein
VNHGHYVDTKDGPVWVGPSRAELAHIRARLEIAREGLKTIAAGIKSETRSNKVLVDDALSALRRSQP